MEENLHRDYVPTKVIDHIANECAMGAVVKLRFIKVRNCNWFERLRKQLSIPKYKDIYFWLPYKSVVENNSKYSIVGKASRFPYANIWLEVKEDCKIYDQGLEKYTIEQKVERVSSLASGNAWPFRADELTLVTRKSVIRTLDQYSFQKKKKVNKTLIKK